MGFGIFNMNHSFKKGERLKRRKLIGRMFNREGSSFAAYPLRIIWLEAELDSDFPAQFALSVPKRAFPKAAHRNVLRRRIREAYRLNKHQLYEVLQDHNKQYAIMLLYTAKEPLPYDDIEKAVRKIIRKLTRKL